jgi:hypothetical protein
MNYCVTLDGVNILGNLMHTMFRLHCSIFGVSLVDFFGSSGPKLMSQQVENLKMFVEEEILKILQ